MNQQTKFIIALLHLEGVGRKTAFKIYKEPDFKKVRNEQDFNEFIHNIFNRRFLSKINTVSTKQIYNAFTISQKILDTSESKDVKMLTYDDLTYPSLLRKISDPPLIINYKGNAGILEKNGIVIIGTREPTPNGIKAGEFFAEYYANKGFNIISGLARGCDSVAHRSALKARGATTAILAHGLHTVYPKENEELACRILSNGGLLLSEYFYGIGILKNYFVERDRLQSGLSRGTIVIQTDVKGGTMHAVNETIRSNKPLAAVNYSSSELLNDKTKGNQLLIKDGKAFPLSISNAAEFENYISYPHGHYQLNEKEKLRPNNDGDYVQQNLF